MGMKPRHTIERYVNAAEKVGPLYALALGIVERAPFVEKLVHALAKKRRK